MYFVYILRSLKDKKCYTGITKDIKERLEYHNNGYVRSTKNRIPFMVAYQEKHKTRLEARKREKYLKSYEGSRQKLSILESSNKHSGIV